MTGMPDPVRSGQNVLRDPPPDLDLALGQHEVGPVPDESVFHKKIFGFSRSCCLVWRLSKSTKLTRVIGPDESFAHKKNISLRQNCKVYKYHIFFSCKEYTNDIGQRILIL